MEKRILGRTGLKLSAISFGAMTIGGVFGPVDDNESIRALHAAVDSGVNFIDTSDAYGVGHSEEVIARFLKERPDRERILICTKGGNNRVTRQLNFSPGRFAENHQFAAGDVRARVLTPENIKKFGQKLNKLKEISGDTGISTADLAIRFCVSNPNVSTVTIGIRTVKQAEQNAACSQALPKELMDKLQKL